VANFYRAYWDACAWIALINQEPTHHNTLRDIYEKAFCGVDLMIGDGARKLLRQYPALNKPQDAIHVMTALYHNLDVMHTFDPARQLQSV